jgi:adenosylcobinamide kinase/adenosylcobinamide-phosphate guanylyltransferase
MRLAQHNPDNMALARSELILGGQKSGKSRRAEALVARWLADDPGRQAVLIATALGGDDEMRQRIARHQQDRAARVPGLRTVEEPWQLAQAIGQHSQAQTLVLVDCLTLWLTNGLMPMDLSDTNTFTKKHPLAHDHHVQVTMLLEAIDAAPGPLVLVGNEIGLGVIPLGAQVRSFVDALGLLNQQVAARCQRVTLMVAGLPLTLKDL